MTASAPSFRAAPPSFVTAGSTARSLPRFAAASAVTAATVLTMTAAFLAIAHVAGGMRFGDGTHSAIVDALHVVTILLLAPIPLALHRVLAPVDRRASAAAVALAVDAIVFGAVLHALFAAGLWTFEGAGPLVLVGYLAFAGWLWMVGSIGSRSGRLSNGRRMAVLGATIVLLPVWLVWIARELDHSA